MKMCILLFLPEILSVGNPSTREAILTQKKDIGENQKNRDRFCR